MNENNIADMIDAYGDLIFSICYKITNNYFDAQDLTQETFLSAYKNQNKFDGMHMKAWLSKIATNKCLDYKKRACHRITPTEDDVLMQIQATELTPLQECLDIEIQQTLFNVCKQLKAPYDTISNYYFCENRPIKEIAELTNKNIKTIQTQVYRAKAMIKKIWKEEKHEATY